MVGSNNIKFHEIIVFDDFLNQPDVLIKLSRNIEYYNTLGGATGLTIRKDQTNKPPGAWRGFRSDNLVNIDKDLCNSLKTDILNRLLPNYDHSDFEIELFLHFTPETITYDEDWWHIDPHCDISGVIYLNKDIYEKSKGGTRIIDHNGLERIIENKYNRLVAYSSILMHRPDSCFGSNIDNTRLTLTFFIISKK